MEADRALFIDFRLLTLDGFGPSEQSTTIDQAALHGCTLAIVVFTSFIQTIYEIILHYKVGQS